MSAIHVADLEFKLMASPGIWGGHGTMQFRWDRRIPWEVLLVLPTETWHISRDTLTEGVDFADGDGLIYVRHVEEGVEIVLASPKGGEAVLLFDRDDLLDFLDMTWQVVPAGAETIDIDSGLDKLLGRAS
ncbi:SsgA family sporulation/cell division regulator [Amycolatopsis sp. NPDC006131]|uniref:SsgA family sporulation/cell division regulator n=1 Tax=Amycolatopsis sp. NPDC006131 TaxID=3156731 RepID=UPI0033A95954